MKCPKCEAGTIQRIREGDVIHFVCVCGYRAHPVDLAYEIGNVCPNRSSFSSQHLPVKYISHNPQIDNTPLMVINPDAVARGVKLLLCKECGQVYGVAETYSRPTMGLSRILGA